MFIIAFATFLDDTLCRSYHHVYPLVFGPALWHIQARNDRSNFVLLNNELSIRRQSSSLKALLDLFHTYTATHASDNICVFDDGELLIEATDHECFGGTVHGVRILELPQDHVNQSRSLGVLLWLAIPWVASTMLNNMTMTFT